MAKYLITGATGLIGSALIKFLISKDNFVVSPVRDINKAKRIFNNNLVTNLSLLEIDLCEYLKTTNEKFDYIIHCASPTASRYFVEQPVETLRFGIDSTISVLEYSRYSPVKSIVYLSSLESYGTITDNKQILTEDIQGYVNPLDVRSSYNIVKRTCECLCHSYYSEYGVPVKIVRLTQTISPNIQPTDNRVFAQFARKAAYGEDIELHTEGISARQYIYIDDAVDAIMTVLNKGKSGDAYNAANDCTYISAKDLASFVQQNFNPAGKVLFKPRADMGYAPTTKLYLDTTKLRNLGWSCKYSLYDMYDILITHLQQDEDQGQ